MRIPQLSAHIANQPGHLIAPLQTAGRRGNQHCHAFAWPIGEEFGILRLIVRDCQRAREVLEAAGFAVTVTEVLAIEVRDQPGGLVELLEVFSQAGINVEYMYAFTARLGDQRGDGVQLRRPGCGHLRPDPGRDQPRQPASRSTIVSTKSSVRAMNLHLASVL